MLRGPEGLALIDFDDSGFGFRLYDLGTLMIQNLEEPAYPQLLAAALAGYEEIRPLGDHAALLPDFVALRAMASCGWIVPRTAPEDARRRLYAARALAQAREVLGRA
ncbi:hypothetical protein FGG78_43935 [Thioclava sp. BHET1]|nr:hypothetical protein FGG78_43935 [Thioclava sp. BHET1]